MEYLGLTSERLAELRDTGLTEEQIKKFNARVREHTYHRD